MAKKLVGATKVVDLYDIGGETLNFLEVPIPGSPFITSGTCGICGIRYQRLAYIPGQVTRSPHFHDQEGGVYYFNTRFDLNRFVGSWVAELQPGGQAVFDNAFVRSPWVLVKQIHAVCKGGKLYKRTHLPKEIDHGFLYRPSTGRLRPLCEECVQFTNKDKINLTFRFTDTGNLAFSEAIFD